MSTPEQPRTEPAKTWADVKAVWNRHQYADLSDAELAAKGLSRVPSSGRARYYAQRAATIGYSASAMVLLVAVALASTTAAAFTGEFVFTLRRAPSFTELLTGAPVVGNSLLVVAGAYAISALCALIVSVIGAAGPPAPSLTTLSARFLMHLALLAEYAWLARMALDTMSVAYSSGAVPIYITFLVAPIIMLGSFSVFRDEALERWGAKTPCAAKPEAKRGEER